MIEIEKKIVPSYAFTDKCSHKFKKLRHQNKKQKYWTNFILILAMKQYCLLMIPKYILIKIYYSHAKEESNFV